MQQIEFNKAIATWELYREIQREYVPGVIMECGVFKGKSLLRLAYCSNSFGDARKLVAFDTFSKFPEAQFKEDKPLRDRFISQNGDTSLSKDEVLTMMWQYAGLLEIELIGGNICDTVPAYVQGHQNLKIALLNIDVDLYEPTKVILEYLLPRVSEGGIVICDDYLIFPGATKAIDEYCEQHNVELKSLDWFNGYYIQKEGEKCLTHE